jgi:hypothetical protein
MHCVGLATILTFLSWTGFVVVTKNFYWPWLSMALLIFSCLFSLLLLAHTIAFFVRQKKPDAARAGTTSGVLNE